MSGAALDDVAAGALAHRLVVHLLTRYGGVRLPARAAPGLLDARTVDDVAGLVEARLGGPLALDDLAAVAHLSPFHFARAFARTTGLAPHRFVSARRMDRARRLLWTSDLTVEEIAQAVGYGNLSHFRRVFRRQHGVAPSALRTARGTAAGPQESTSRGPSAIHGELKRMPTSSHVFTDGDVPLAARIHRATDDPFEPQPGVVVLGSWLTVKEQMADHYAAALAARGYTAMTFDFAGFGASGGSCGRPSCRRARRRTWPPRPAGAPPCPIVRPGGPGVVAICASAQYTLAAIAAGAPIRSFASVAGWFHDARSVAAFYGGADGVRARLERGAAAADAVLRRRRPGDGAGVRARRRPGRHVRRDGLLRQPGARRRPAWRNEMSELTWAHWLTYDGLSAAPRVRRPGAARARRRVRVPGQRQGGRGRHERAGARRCGATASRPTSTTGRRRPSSP